MKVYSDHLLVTFVALLVLAIGCSDSDDPVSPDPSGTWSVTIEAVGTAREQGTGTTTGHGEFLSASFTIHTDTTWAMGSEQIYMEMILRGEAVSDTVYSGTIRHIQKAYGSDVSNSATFRFNAARTSFRTDPFERRDDGNNALGIFLVKGSKL